MSSLLPWLPEIIDVNGSFDEVVNRLYTIFHRDIVLGYPRLDGTEVWFDRTVKPGKAYEEGFWHLIERDHYNNGNRSFDPRRAERLPWCAPMLNNFHMPEIKCWMCNERGKLMCYVWLEDYDYVIILEKRTLPPKMVGTIVKPARTIVFLKTAYHIDGESRRRHFRRKYSQKIS